MIKSIIAILTAVASFVCGCFLNVADTVFFPDAPQTDSVEFAKKLGNGWNLGNTLEACEKGSSEKKVSKAKYIGAIPIQPKK